jgi:hypothetical protein
VKLLILAVSFLTAYCFSAAAADRENCSINVAKRFADGVIAADRKTNGDSGVVVYQRSKSVTYTIENLEERIRLGSDTTGAYKRMRDEMIAHPDYRFYSLQYQVREQSGNHTAYYWKVHLKNYDRGCALESIISD